MGLSAGKLTNGKMEQASVYHGPRQDLCFQLHWASALRLTCHTSHLILVFKIPLMQAQTRRSGLWAVCLVPRALPWCVVHQHVCSIKWLACSARQGRRFSKPYASSIPGYVTLQSSLTAGLRSGHAVCCLIRTSQKRHAATNALCSHASILAALQLLSVS